jgi:hypothetical protein
MEANMANRTFNQFGGTLERKVVKLFAKITYSGGAPTLVTSEVINAGTSPVTVNPSQGFQSLVDNSGGNFSLVLGANNGGVPTYDPYVRLLNYSVSSVIPGPGLPTDAVLQAICVNNNVTGSSGNPSLTLQLLCINPGTGVISPGLPDNGTTVFVEITLSNTTAY